MTQPVLLQVRTSFATLRIGRGSKFQKARHFRSTTLSLETSGSEDSGYVDRWLDSIRKEGTFYERLASSGSRRCYFYNVDLLGRLFLEETTPKNIATSIKDTKFIDFFYKRMRSLSKGDRLLMNELGIPIEEYPYVSQCGKEMNFIRPVATPVVFHSFGDDRDPKQSLIYAGSLTQSFDEKKLSISRLSGRLYHKLTDQTLLERMPTGHDQGQFGLMVSSLAVNLSERIVPDDGTKSENLLGSGLSIETAGGDLMPITWLPSYVESSGWVQ